MRKRGHTYQVIGLGQVRFEKDEPKGMCIVFFLGKPVKVEKHEVVALKAA